MGAQLAVEDFRRAHPDIPVEVVSADLQLKPDVALAISGKWFDADGVDVVPAALGDRAQDLAALCAWLGPGTAG